MPVGPFDRRKKRSRCLACAASHLKKPNQIRIDHAEPDDKAVARVGCRPKSLSPLVVKPSDDQIYHLSHYFDIFLRCNNFNPKTEVLSDVLSLMKDQSSGTFLHDAVLSLGAMQATKLNSSEGIDSSKTYNLAVYHYSKSVMGLRHALEKFDQVPSARHRILWTTHLLGLFELMSDSTGQGWIQHLVHGTSKALVAAGPTACQSGRGRRFFTEIRIFEVCRAIIFNAPTFLATSDWRNLTDEMLTKDRDGAHSLDELLDIIVSCSSLRVRASRLIYSSEENSPGHPQKRLDDACDIAQDGFCFRQVLIDWETKETFSDDLTREKCNSVSDSFSLLARAFFSATSIYLSGVFDYEIPYWQEMGIVAPNLSEEEIQMHVITILTCTSTILHSSSISPLLVLFPLRVAGARSWQNWQQECIMQYLSTIERTFPVASAFKADLKRIWAQRSPAG
ncbi:hypothetical protein F53441_3692 [Fusarium austroafricanum]|uniref:Uncharacterized protein n=1 Tax=Fusarium austroafricanum TaxID=2364996 RepID=A0A8H4KQ24_9HYPO|nr:hypothetical protein F53441_3692 [Fusarium austroafricanum]